MKNNISVKIKRLNTVAIFCALAYICQFVFRIDVQFLTFDLKDAVLTVGAMYLGPLAGLAMSVIVPLLEFITISDTGIYGLIMNVCSSAVFTCTAALIYKYRRKMSGAIIGLVSSVVGMTAVMLALNLLITPYYTGAPLQAVISMIPTLLLPFNLTKAVLNAAVVLLLYKPITYAIKAAKLITPEKKEESKNAMKKEITIAVIITSVVIIAASIAVFIFVLNGKIN